MKIKIITLLIAFIITGCGPAEESKDIDGISERLQALVNSMIDRENEDPIHNTVLLVDCPRIKWKGAAGMADGENEPMIADHKIKTASITKTLTATMVLQLMEEGHLDLSDSIDKFLDNSIVNVDNIHIYEGMAYGRFIGISFLALHPIPRNFPQLPPINILK